MVGISLTRQRRREPVVGTEERKSASASLSEPSREPLFTLFFLSQRNGILDETRLLE